MAEAPPVVDEGLIHLLDEVTCPVCHDVFEEPKILPCCHYYCKKCIKQLVDYAGPNRPFDCPECRLATLVPQNDPNKLTTAFFVNRLKELHGKMEKAHGKVEAPCEQCRGGVSVAFCRQCAEFICADCVKSHQKMKVFTSHKVVTLEELKKGGAKQILVSRPPPPKCSIHDELMKIFCFDCNLLICRDCIVIDHANHKYDFVKVAAPETKKQLAEHLGPLKEVQANLSKATEVVQVTKSEIVAQGKSVAENIEQSFQELHEILEQHKNRLLMEATKTVEEKASQLSTQQKGLNTASAVIQSLVDFVEQNLENATDEEFMTIHKQILSRIDKAAEEHRKRAIDLEPVEIADLKVEISCAEKIHQACQTNAKLHQLADPSKCKVDGPGLNSAQVNQQTHVIVHTMLHNGPTKKPQKVTGELKSLVNGSVTQLEGVRKQGNTYEIQFSSAVRGRHQLAVSVNDQPIAGSTFPVYVKIPPTQLGRPVRVLGGLDGPCRVAVNSAEEVLVTERKKIAVFDKKGKKLRDIKLPTDDVDLNGIAIDEDDNIYVADCRRHCLVKLNKAGKVLKTVGTRGRDHGAFNNPRGVAVIGDRVFECDSDNHRLQVFTKERLEFVKTIGSQGQGDEHFKSPLDITQDKLGNMYVSDFGRNCVKLLNKQGEFKLSFSKKANGQLNRPSGVCVVDQFVYVVEFLGHCVSVFSRDGQFVTSFGKRGKKEGEFVLPYGICVDCDGFVYVCDYWNRVQVF